MTKLGKLFSLSADTSLHRRLEAYLEQIGPVDSHHTMGALLALVRRRMGSVVIVDTRHAEAFDFLGQVRDSKSGPSVIALVEPKSDMEHWLGEFKVFATFPHNFDRLAFQRSVVSACDHAQLLANGHEEKQAEQPHHAFPSASAAVAELSTVMRLMRSLASTDDVLNELVTAMGDLLKVNRLALVLRQGDQFQLMAGTKLNRGQRKQSWKSSDVLPHILEAEAKPVSRSELAELDSTDEAEVLRSHLELFHAEYAVPLFCQDELAGWYLAGKPLAKKKSGATDPFQLMQACEATIGIIESALQADRLQLQHGLLEAVVSSLPIGLLALDQELRLIWLNQQAHKNLDRSYDDVIGRDVSALPTPVHLTMRKLAGKPELNSGDCEWQERVYRIVRLQQPDQTTPWLFSMVDVTDSEMLEAEHLNRSRAELLSGINESLAFSLRSPLTAIRTFAQLLPENQNDSEFVERFNEIVCAEVDRLTELSSNLGTVSRLVTKSNGQNASFALTDAVEVARQLVGDDWKRCRIEGDASSFQVTGDGDRLGEGLCYLLQNALEASPDPVILAFYDSSKQNGTVVEVAVKDSRPTSSQGAFVDNSVLENEVALEKADTRLRIAARILAEFGSTLKTETRPNGVCVYCQLSLAETAETGHST